MIDVEITLVKAFHWSLYEIDKTDISSLFPFYFRLAKGGRRQRTEQASAYCDEVSWL